MTRTYFYILISLFISISFFSCASVEVKAASKGDIGVLQEYLISGGEIDASRSWGRTLLMIASDSNQLSAVQFLLENGADPELVAGNGKTVLISASGKGRLEMVQFFLDYGVSVNQTASRGMTALHNAALYDRPEVVELLLEYGADSTIRSDSLRTPLLMALEDSADRSSGLTRSTRILLQTSDKINGDDSIAESIAFSAAASGNIDVMDLLVENGFDVRSEDLWGNTLLFPAIENPPMINYLIDKGISVNESNFYRDTALFAALNRRNRDSISILLNNRADPDIRNKAGKTVLLEAADMHAPQIVGLLIVSGAGLYRTDKKGNNALHLASLNGDPETVRLLLIAGIDPNSKNSAGATPLALAVNNAEYSESIIELLIIAGAIAEEE